MEEHVCPATWGGARLPCRESLAPKTTLLATLPLCTRTFSLADPASLLAAACAQGPWPSAMPPTRAAGAAVARVARTRTINRSSSGAAANPKVAVQRI